MSMQYQGRERMLEQPQFPPSSSSPTCNTAYVYIISSPSDAADGPKAKEMKETINKKLMADFDFHLEDDQVPVAQPWPESKSTFAADKPSTSSAAAAAAAEEEDDDIDEQLKAIVESLRDLYRESHELVKKIFSRYLRKKEDQTDPKRKAVLELGNKRISRILKQTKDKQMKGGMLQRSLSVGSPRTPLGRFKIKTFDLRGTGGGETQDVKGSAEGS